MLRIVFAFFFSLCMILSCIPEGRAEEPYFNSAVAWYKPGPHDEYRGINISLLHGSTYPRINLLVKADEGTQSELKIVTADYCAQAKKCHALKNAVVTFGQIEPSKVYPGKLQWEEQNAKKAVLFSALWRDAGL